MTDVLDDLLDLIRIERADFLVIEVGAPGGVAARLDGNVWFHLVLAGQVWMTAGAKGEAHCLSRGDVALVVNAEQFALRDTANSPLTQAELPEMSHSGDLAWLRYGGTGPKSLIVSGAFRLDRDRARPLLRRLSTLLVTHSETGSLPYWAGPLCDVTALRLLSSGPGAMAVLRRLAEALFIQTVRVFMSQADMPVERILSTLCRPQVSRALRLLNARPEQDWTVSSLAREAGMSRSAFAAAFAAEVGQSPMQYLTGVRMATAADLLRSHAVTVSQVAARVGFVSETSFARTFKRHFGVAPGSFRRPEDLSPAAAAAREPVPRSDYPGFIFFA